jgi:hypothetical protein
MDIYKDMRRSQVTTEFIFKTAKIYERMVEDQGADLKYVLKCIPKTSVGYDPDDYSPWSWL